MSSIYTIGECIGSGGMAHVYLARQEGLWGFDKLVVFKRMSRAVADDPSYVASFLKEARVAATMSHPNIVSALDVGQDALGPYIVMEYLSGETLSFVSSELRRRKQQLPPVMACRIATAIAGALEFAHGQTPAIIHRDVSPSNVMCCYNGTIKLLDFGIAKVTDEEHTRVDTLKGKLTHMSPEQVQGKRVDATTDVFQLGIVTWEMLVGRRLIRGSTHGERLHALLMQPLVRPSEANPAVPPALDEPVMWALERDPSARCPSAVQFAEALARCLPDVGPTGGERELGGWMRANFPERLVWREELEQRARTLQPSHDTSLGGAGAAGVPGAHGTTDPGSATGSVTLTEPSLVYVSLGGGREALAKAVPGGLRWAIAGAAATALVAAVPLLVLVVLVLWGRPWGGGTEVPAGAGPAEPAADLAEPVVAEPVVAEPAEVAPPADPRPPAREAAAPRSPAPAAPAPAPAAPPPLPDMDIMTDNRDPWATP